jgi:hypothetical protein
MITHKMELPEGVAAIYNKEVKPYTIIISTNCIKDKQHLIDLVKESVIAKGIIYAN